MWDFIDKAVYINLDHREDRRQIMNRFFEEGKIPEEKVQRFSAVHDSCGMIGCAKSHIGVLKLAKAMGWKSVLVMEDDLEWINFEEKYTELEKLVETETWDVCMLTGKYLVTTPPKINFAMHSNAYIVKEHYYDTLIANMETGLARKQNFLVRTNYTWFRKNNSQAVENHVFNIDVYWTFLQQSDNWIGIMPVPICQQVMTYSDINKKVICPSWCVNSERSEWATSILNFFIVNKLV